VSLLVVSRRPSPSSSRRECGIVEWSCRRNHVVLQMQPRAEVFPFSGGLADGKRPERVRDSGVWRLSLSLSELADTHSACLLANEYVSLYDNVTYQSHEYMHVIHTNSSRKNIVIMKQRRVYAWLSANNCNVVRKDKISVLQPSHIFEGLCTAYRRNHNNVLHPNSVLAYLLVAKLATERESFYIIRGRKTPPPRGTKQ
jgi:hypothetical protein